MTVARADSAYPMLLSLRPVAVQVGQTSECELVAHNSLQGAYNVLVEGDGVTAEVAPPETGGDKPSKPSPERLKLRFHVAADAMPGAREFRVATPLGVSTVGQLVVVRDAVIAETAENDSLAAAQTVSLPSVLAGAIEKNEDVDFFKFHVDAGAALVFHVRGARLEDKIHDLQPSHMDALLTVRNGQGSVVAAADNYFGFDPLLVHEFAEAADYFLQVRDARYQGNAHWQYAIEVSARPFVVTLHPLGQSPGHSRPVTLVGHLLGTDPLCELSTSAAAPEGITWALPQLRGEPTNPVAVVHSSLALIDEGAGENGTPESAQVITAPSGVSGRIDSAGDIDCYALDAKKGDLLSVEVMARRVQSALDPIVRIVDASCSTLAENDDLSTGRHSSADSQIEGWAAPADGRYAIEIRDLHDRGAPAFTYFLRVEPSRPYFALEADTDKTQLSPGAASPIFVRVYRKNGFVGEVQLAIEGLPPGVTATCGRILADGSDGAIMLEAAADAPMAATNVQITGHATLAASTDQPAIDLVAAARPLQEIYMPGGGRGHYPVETHAVAVGAPADIRAVRLSANSVALKPGESQRVEVAIERAEGFEQDVTLDVVYQHLESIYGSSLPKGVKIDDRASKLLLRKGESEGFITLTAAADAKPVEPQLVPVMAHVSINFVMKRTYSGPPFWVCVSPAAADAPGATTGP